MRLRDFLIIVSAVMIFSSCDKENNNEVRGCTNEVATNYDPKATMDCGCCEFKQADVVFWADSASVAFQCDGNASVLLKDSKTGQEVTTFSFQKSEPANCDSTQVGHIRVNVGSYFFTLYIDDPDCDVGATDGTIVLEEGCNKVKLF